MRYLYNEYFKKQGRGYTSEEFQKACELMAGKRLDDFFAKYVRGTAEIDYSAIMNGIGLQVTSREASGNRGGAPGGAAPIPAIGADLTETNGVLTIRTITAGTPAYEQGLNTGDQIIAIDGMRASQTFLQSAIAVKKTGDKIKLTIFRFDEMRTVEITLGSRVPQSFRISPARNATEQQRQMYQAWLKTGP